MFSPPANGRAGPSHSPAFAPASMRSDTLGPMDAAKQTQMEIFRKVKPTCVRLLSLTASPPSSSSPHAALLSTLTSTLRPYPPSSLSPNLINYTLFPLTQLLRLHPPSTLPPPFLEAAFELLELVVRAWRADPMGLPAVVWAELWKFVVAAVAGRGSKGKERDLGQEVYFRAVNLLSALLEPSDSIMATTMRLPTEAMLDQVTKPTSPLTPTLFQTLTLLLSPTCILPSPVHHPLQLASLRLLRPILAIYFRGQHEMLASVLPGVVSSMSKLVKEQGRGLRGEVGDLAAGIVGEVVTATLNDEDLRRLGVLRDEVRDLSELDDWTPDPLPPDDTAPPSPAPSTTSSATPANPFPPLTPSYLAFTSTQLLATIPPILTALTSHPSDLCRQAASTLAYNALTACHDALPSLVPHCLNCLLLLVKDDFDTVRLAAQQHLRQLLHVSSGPQLDLAFTDLLSQAMNALPRLITSQQDAKVDEAARLVTSLADVTSELGKSLPSSSEGRTRNPIADLLGPAGHVERWSYALLGCLEFGRPSGWSAGHTASRQAQRGWETNLLGASATLLLDGAGSGGDEGFPHLPLRYVESVQTTRTLEAMLAALGRAGGEPALHSVEYLAESAKAHSKGDPARAVPALWVAQKLLAGIVQDHGQAEHVRPSKRIKAMAKEISKIVVEMESDEDDEDEADLTPPKDETSEALLPVERTKGLDALTTLLDRPSSTPTYTAAETRRLHSQAQRSLLTCLSLTTLALTSQILSTSFRPLLLTALYPILAHLASPSELIASHAHIALKQVAYHTGYASPQNLVLDNTDYVINSVSQRLTYARLSPTGPLVLIAMIKLVGAGIVPQVHDIIDEIFDCLDDFHGYATLVSGLLAVLVGLIDVMAEGVELEGMTDARRKKREEYYNRVDTGPDPARDFDRFKGWWLEREKRRGEEVEEILERAPQHAWGKPQVADDGGDNEVPNGNQAQGAAAEEEELNPPPSRTQEICIAILSRSLHLLAHPSPFLRARILSLVSRSTAVLAAGNREGDLLPLIDRAWAMLLNRLDDDSPEVVCEAAEVLASLCEHVGDYMGRRVVDHAWPRLQRLVKAREEVDKRSALVKRCGTGMESSKYKYTVSYRLHRAVIRVARFVVREVPVKEAVVWEMGRMFRSFLHNKAHEELQDEARALFREWAKRDEDAVWVILRASMGNLPGGKGGDVWGYLSEDGLDIEGNAGLILGEMDQSGEHA